MGPRRVATLSTAPDTPPGGVPCSGGRVPYGDRRSPYGPCGQPVDHAPAWPTACPHSRASRPQPPQDQPPFGRKKHCALDLGDPTDHHLPLIHYSFELAPHGLTPLIVQAHLWIGRRFRRCDWSFGQYTPDAEGHGLMAIRGRIRIALHRGRDDDVRLDLSGGRPSRAGRRRRAYGSTSPCAIVSAARNASCSCSGVAVCGGSITSCAKRPSILRHVFSRALARPPGVAR